MFATIYPITANLTAKPLNSNVGFNNSWVLLENNFIPEVPLFAQLTYATNLGEIAYYIDGIENSLDLTNVYLDALTGLMASFIGREDAFFIALTTYTYNIDQDLDRLISLSQEITTNLVDVENETKTIVTLSQNLTAKVQEIEIDTNRLISLNESLTALFENKQNAIITLNNVLTTLSNDIETNTDQLEGLLEATNAYLQIIIGWDFATETTLLELSGLASDIKSLIQIKQDRLISLSESLTANTDNIEPLLDSLTSKNTDIISLLNVLTANTDSLEINTDYLETYLDSLTSLSNSLTSLTQTEFDQTQTYLDSLTSINQKIPGFEIPPFDEINLSYYGTTNNLNTAEYLKNSTTVLTLSFVYLPQPPLADDATLIKVKKM